MSLRHPLQAKAISGEPVGHTRKQKKVIAKAKAAPAKVRAEDIVLLPEQVSIPAGVFTSPSGPLQQIRLDDVGPSSAGVVVVTPEQAAKYLRIPRPISAEALGLIVLGPLSTEGSTLHSGSVRFHALCPSSGEPLLLNGLLMQVGDQYVVKHTPAVANLDVVQSVVQRISVYRDEWEGDWASFTASPLKAIVAIVPLLRTCDSEGCECQSWHGLTSAGKPEAILEAWNRTFCTENFRASLPATATVFTIYVRVPLALEEPLQPYSGCRGVYLEPRGLTSREPSATFRVVWVPKAGHADVLLLRQSHSLIVGLARVAKRYGVRCLAPHEPELHGAIRPSSLFLDRDGLQTFLAGPFPHGTRRESLLKLFSEIKWSARPLQPEPATPQGIWWKIQSNAKPSTQVLHTQYGEVLLSEVKAKPAPVTRAPVVVASNSYLRTLACRLPRALAEGTDPLQVDDPWARALAAPSGPSDASRAWQQVASQVEKSVLAKVGAASPAGPGPSGPSGDPTTLAASVENIVMAKVDARLGELEASVSTRLQALGGRVDDVAAEVKQQESVLQGMFDTQMMRIEELLNPKRNRCA